MLKEAILTKAQELANADFTYSFTNNFDTLNSLDDDCSGIVVDATVLYFEIKNIPSMLKTGKRLASRVYKMYHHALLEIAQATQGHFSCYSPQSFLLIYPKENHDVVYAVDVALHTAELFSTRLRDTFEQLAPMSFSIGLDKGNILGTKAISDNGNNQIAWIGTTIDKAKAICHECNRPFFVGISGTVHQHLDEDHRVITKRVMGFKKQVDIWTTASYQFENVKKHLYQTNLLKPFEE